MAPRRITEAQAVQALMERGARPLEAFPGTQHPWRCQCLTCGEVHTPRYSDVVNKGSGVCRGTCRSRKISNRLRRDGTQAAATMQRWGWLPLEPYPGAAKPWRSRCAQCAAVKIKRLSHVRNGHARCNHCAGRALGAVAAAEIMTSAELAPLTAYPGQQMRPWLSRCLRCGHLGTPTLASVRLRGHQCWACKAAAFPVRHPLDEQQAVACMITHGLEPLEPYSGDVNAPWRSRCTTCDSDSAPVPGSIPGHHRACPVCARLDISPVEPGYLYLAVHDDLRALGWAVAQGRHRLHSIGRSWRPLARWHLAAAQDAWAFGRHLKQQLRGNGCPPVPKADAAPDMAWAQTVSLEHVSTGGVVRIVEDVAGPAC
ncbi:hypothetical protein RI578_41985 (plasmid) [Streptomyces sp. BB1-1-1]|uniref:hypothetical protein n=1 Tax=Streptomyces sp. BB1-1-1 TaxID=3074430 RepID=UPI0028780BB3|nr:hypothetical protein [Streptomyces sp. BB1-1-1]WND32904.1 hypothetical protein RI578_00645 [Streptomyces sp. BB1-1-1]WND40027.1 hypothetical protein RI578_39760 [Streptomyces sp. BB1-1-1]WND40861.1 hypothetical protein RI578_41985 [Streptomyces sp. BB1-1-1]